MSTKSSTGKRTSSSKRTIKTSRRYGRLTAKQVRQAVAKVSRKTA